MHSLNRPSTRSFSSNEPSISETTRLRDPNIDSQRRLCTDPIDIPKHLDHILRPKHFLNSTYI